MKDQLSAAESGSSGGGDFFAVSDDPGLRTPDPGPSPAPAGLFERHDIIATLLERGLSSRRDAKRQIARHGLALCRAGIEHCDFLDRQGEIRKTWARAFYHWITQVRVVDERISRERKPAIRETPDTETAPPGPVGESPDVALHRFIITTLDDQVRRDLERDILAAMPHVKPGHKAMSTLVAQRFLETSA